MKDILVHLDTTPACAGRLELAALLAQRNDAALIGLFAQADPAVSGFTSNWPTEWYRTAASASRTSFASLRDGKGLRGEWHDAGSGHAETIIDEVIAGARHASLAVIGQSEAGTGVPAELPEQVILQSGRPVLVVPHTGRYPTVGERALIAWNGSREASRALEDSLPLLKGARDVTVMHLENNRKRRGPDDSNAVVAHLARHGIKAHVDSLRVDDIGVMDMLLNSAADLGADLLVMGAHGHYGFPHFNRGAGTRHILRTMTLPVLMSH